MKAKLFDEMLVVTLSRGDKLVESLKAACAANSVETGSVNGIGSVLSAELQNYVAETSSYVDCSVSTPYEIISLLGNVSRKDGKIHTHLHIALADAAGSLVGGHLKEAVINGNCEIFVQRLSVVLDRRLNPETGLSPLDLEV